MRKFCLSWCLLYYQLTASIVVGATVPPRKLARIVTINHIHHDLHRYSSERVVSFHPWKNVYAPYRSDSLFGGSRMRNPTLHNIIIIIYMQSTLFSVLSSSLGGRRACIGEQVTLTCEVTGTGRLTWVICTDGNTILFDLLQDSSSLSGSHHDSTGRFTASLTNFSHSDPPYSFLGNLTSKLSVEISSADEHCTIGCQDGIVTDTPHLNLSIAGL